MSTALPSISFHRKDGAGGYYEALTQGDANGYTTWEIENMKVLKNMIKLRPHYMMQIMMRALILAHIYQMFFLSNKVKAGLDAERAE